MLSAEKYDLIRLINLYKNSGIYFWGLNADENGVTLKVGIFSAERALSLASEIGVSLTVLKSVGLPFIINRHKKRFGILAGAIISAIIVFSSIFFVWDIQITGNVNISEERILAVLAKNGVYTGSFIPSISTHTAEQKTILTFPDISSVAIVIDGTHITVDIIERIRPPRIEEGLLPGISSIYAKKPGVIVSVVAESGKVTVSPGYEVNPGDLLVTGIYPGSTGVEIGVRSKATVMAKTENQFAVSIPLTQVKRIYTGKETAKTTASILGKSFELFMGGLIDYNSFDAVTETHQAYVFGKFKLPITLTTVTAREYRTVNVKISKEEGIKKAIAAFNSKLSEYKNDDVLAKSYECFFDENANCITLVGNYSLLEDIGLERENQISESP